MKQLLREYLLAVQYFTRIPVTGPLAEWAGFSPALLRASAAHFPGVGWIVGMAACLVFALSSLLLGETAFTPLAAAALCCAATAMLTGAFHEDGLADLADGLGGGSSRERALEIMKDSRIGSFGALALVLALAARLALLAVLAARAPGLVLAALLAGHAVSRFWPLLTVRTLPNVSDLAGSKSKPLADRISGRALGVAAAWCLPPLVVLALAGGPDSLAGALLASGLAWWFVRRMLARRLQGFTGDGLGATQQVCEIAFYFGAALQLGAR